MKRLFGPRIRTVVGSVRAYTCDKNIRMEWLFLQTLHHDLCSYEEYPRIPLSKIILRSILKWMYPARRVRAEWRSIQVPTCYLDETLFLRTSWYIRGSSSVPVTWYNCRLRYASNYKSRTVEECRVFCWSKMSFCWARTMLAAIDINLSFIPRRMYECRRRHNYCLPPAEEKISLFRKKYKYLCERFGKNETVFSQSIYIRRVCINIAVASQSGSQIVDDDQQEIRTRDGTANRERNHCEIKAGHGKHRSWLITYAAWEVNAFDVALERRFSFSSHMYRLFFHLHISIHPYAACFWKQKRRHIRDK